MKIRTWRDVAAHCDRLGFSRAELARRAGLSESAIVKGIARDSKLRGATRRVVEQVFSEELPAEPAE